MITSLFDIAWGSSYIRHFFFRVRSVTSHTFIRFLISFLYLSIFWFLEREFDIHGRPIRLFAHRTFGIGGGGVGLLLFVDRYLLDTTFLFFFFFFEFSFVRGRGFLFFCSTTGSFSPTGRIVCVY